jgi:hypothetical protein
MGKCETAAAAIGLKILLSHLVLQMNETNYNIIMKMLQDGYIEDDNDYFNEVYEGVIWDENVTDNSNFLDIKRYLISEFQNKGAIRRTKFSSKEEPELRNGCLFDKYLLVPVKQILRTNRWGYDRYGTNCSSRPMDFDLSVDIEEYKGIDKFEIVFIVSHHSS